MDHMRILSRAWAITWRYRVLWLFGFLFVLAGGGGARGTPGGGSNTGWRTGGGSGPFPSGGLPFGLTESTLITIVVVFVLVMLVLVVLLSILRYVAETAIIAGVDEIEGNQQALTVRRGFRLGWSRRALRLFLADLAVYLPLVVAAIAILALAASPLLLLLAKNQALNAVAIVVTIGLALLVILAIIAAVLVVSLVMPYIRRRIVLGGQGVRDAIRQAVKLVRASLADTGLMWLWLLGIGIVWGLVMVPVALAVVVVAVLVGGLPAALVYALSHSVVTAIVVGLPLFLIVLVPVLTLVQGVYQVYTSSAWTLAYRETVVRHGDVLPAAQG